MDSDLDPNNSGFDSSGNERSSIVVASEMACRGVRRSWTTRSPNAPRAVLQLQRHVSRIGFYRLGHSVIENCVDDAGGVGCERQVMLRGETVDTGPQDTVFSNDFSDIKPTFHRCAVLCSDSQ